MTLLFSFVLFSVFSTVRLPGEEEEEEEEKEEEKVMAEEAAANKHTEALRFAGTPCKTWEVSTPT